MKKKIQKDICGSCHWSLVKNKYVCLNCTRIGSDNYKPKVVVSRSSK